MVELSGEPNSLVAAVARRVHHLSNRPPFMLAEDVAELYGVPTKRVAEAVRRNPGRFPPDFAFRLSEAEAMELLRSQKATAKKEASNQTFTVMPMCLTREGVNMLSAVFSTPEAIDRSVHIMRAFSWMECEAAQRGAEVLARSQSPVTDRLERLEQRVDLMVEAITGLGGNVEDLMDAVGLTRLEQLRRKLVADGTLAPRSWECWNKRPIRRNRPCRIVADPHLHEICLRAFREQPGITAPQLLAVASETLDGVPGLRSFQRWLKRRREGSSSRLH